MMGMEKHQYYILNVLRGMSALFVLFYHFFVFFFAYPVTSAGLLQIEPVYLAEPFYLQALKDCPINLGHLGVAFFFVMSGFLIQPTLERYSLFKAYVIHKIFRLWPTYIVCFSTGLLFVFVFCVLREMSFPYTWGHLLSCFFWVRDVFHYALIDGSVWSLEVQVKFYLFAGIVWHLGKKNFLEKMCFLTVIVSLIAFAFSNFSEGEDYSWFYLVPLMLKTLKYFMLILLGTCIYFLYKKQISGLKAIGLCGMLLVCFLSPLFYSPDFAKTLSYLLGFFTFSYVVFFPPQNLKSRKFFSPFINWVSQISYPVYVGHVLPGYVLMYLAVGYGFNIYLAIIVVLLYVFLMADLVHKKIEVLFIKKGNQIISSVA